MSVMLLEGGLFELLESPASPMAPYVFGKAEEVAAFAKQNVVSNFHIRTGKLYDSISVFPDFTRDGLSYEVGTNGAPYGRILELGGEPHDIHAVNRRRLFSEPDNPTPLRNIMLTVVAHPGPQAKPWLVPACVQAGFSVV